MVGRPLLEKISNSPEETKKLGKILAKYLKPGDLILFYGELGSGKTTLIQGICEGLEVDPELYITSPTFSIVNHYEGKYPILHIDLYRLNGEDLYELGIWENLSNSIILIEWAEKLHELPKEDYLEITLDYLNNFQRKITLIGYREWSELLKVLERDEELNK
ncbi:MAG: tRNA (adenosine(37)-N6)-threonylcarbamoyltransferase complex ATPase subunit type 1 TsaE [Caldimicrobium sp.]